MTILHGDAVQVNVIMKSEMYWQLCQLRDIAFLAINHGTRGSSAISLVVRPLTSQLIFHRSIKINVFIYNYIILHSVTTFTRKSHES